jgi:phosphoribosylformimino-5-aminoimidazole carboxamide ribotide isomerase
MIVVPAIDIRDGRAVRLEQGDFSKQTVYESDPLQAARSWAEAGAEALHVVDLDGAREGRPVNLGHLRRITAALDIPVQYGGGLRSKQSVDEAFDAGARFVVLGTGAHNDASFLGAVLTDYQDSVVVSVDARDGYVSLQGWTSTTETSAEALIERLQQHGVAQFLYTSIARDGTMGGFDPEEVHRISEAVSGRFVYSGGIGSIEDLRSLRELSLWNLAGVVAGKALYEGRFSLQEAMAAVGSG